MVQEFALAAEELLQKEIKEAEAERKKTQAMDARRRAFVTKKIKESSTTIYKSMDNMQQKTEEKLDELESAMEVRAQTDTHSHTHTHTHTHRRSVMSWRR